MPTTRLTSLAALAKRCKLDPGASRATGDQASTQPAGAPPAGAQPAGAQPAGGELAGGEPTGADRVRLAGVPLLLAAVVTSGHNWTDHTVRQGETLSEIAARHSADATTLAKANRLRNANRIFAGQRLRVPTKQRPAARHRAAARPAMTYRVRRGDTVSHISARTGIPARDILRANRLRASSLIFPGQRLVLPSRYRPASASAASSESARARPRVYRVRPGDTVSEIAHRFGVSASAVIRRNRLGPSALIRPGQKLVLSGVGGSAAHGSASRGRASQARAARSAVPRTFAGRTYPYAVAHAAAVNRTTLSGREAPSRRQMRRIIARTADRYGVPRSLALAVAYQESGFNQRAVSPANAIGAMQVIPSSGRWASDLVNRRLNLLDPEDNATAGVAILRALLRATDDPRTAIAGYYQGLSSVRRNGMFADTRRYVANVQTLQHRFG